MRRSMAVPDPAHRLKMIRYRAWHRGFREADLILGPFADRYVETFDGPQLDEFEVILEHPDQLLYAWIVGQEETPDEVKGYVFAMLRRYGGGHE
jgi:antitoxin CptB